jgi:hypothetical protein
MKHRPTRSQIAADYALWGEYVDRSRRRMPRAEFDAMSIKEKVKMQNDIFGATPVADLTGVALDWAVAKAIGEYKPVAVPNYSTDWAQGGPIIERERIAVKVNGYGWWFARVGGDFGQGEWVLGDTPLIAAMRVFVASKLGDEIDVPDELTGE